MNRIIEHLKEKLATGLEPADLEILIPQMESEWQQAGAMLNGSLDTIRGQRELLEEIRRTTEEKRRELCVEQEDEITNEADDVAFLLTWLHARLLNVEDDAAALRGTLEHIRDTARKEENDAGDLIDAHRQIYIRDLLGSVAHKASEGLKEHQSGAALRKDTRQLEAMVSRFEQQMQQDGGWRYGGDRTLAERVQRFADHYTRMAGECVQKAHTFKSGVLAWLKGISITSQAVSWASTHHEKDARLRGLIEVVETAINKLDEMQFDQSFMHPWSGEVESWAKSDFPTREMRRKIFDLEEEIKRLRQKAGEEPDVH